MHDCAALVLQHHVLCYWSHFHSSLLGATELEGLGMSTFLISTQHGLYLYTGSKVIMCTKSSCAEKSLETRFKFIVSSCISSSRQLMIFLKQKTQDHYHECLNHQLSHTVEKTIYLLYEVRDCI